MNIKQTAILETLMEGFEVPVMRDDFRSEALAKGMSVMGVTLDEALPLIDAGLVDIRAGHLVLKEDRK